MVWEWMAGAAIVGIVYMLCKPGSSAGTAIANIEAALASVIAKASGNT
jgi:hypothetical protein